MPKKTEKYIVERVSRKGTASLQINIRKNGQTFRKSILISDFPSRKKAMDFACKLRDETLVNMEKGYTVSGFPTVDELYALTFVLLPVRLKTVKRHDSFYNNGIRDVYGQKTIDQIKTSDIQESVNCYAKTHTRVQVSHFIAVWRRIYCVCAMKDINVIDRTLGIKIPECKEGTPRKKEISADDLEKFCDALLKYNAPSEIGHYNCTAIYYAVRIMQYCGLRPAETFALTRKDIDLVYRQISITKAVHSTQDSYNDIGKAKTAQSVRVVPIPLQLVPYLQECFEWSKHDFLLADYSGNLMSIDWVCTLIGNVAKKARVEFNLYRLRHMFSSDLFGAGINAAVIRDLMGHASASMSLDYAISNENDRENAINERKFS